MAVYAISDLHLSLSTDKPMDVFGDRWVGYVTKLKNSWEQNIGSDDIVIIPGDISWAMYLDEALEDLKFINALPGRKIISKGNHDYWWTTMSKLNKFLDKHDLHTINFMHNNSFDLEGVTLCGTRGWISPGDSDFGAEDEKIHARELQRLELSLRSVSLSDKNGIIVAIHYPPFNSRGEPSDFIEIMRKYNVKMCVYGHLHGGSHKNAVEGNVYGIDFRLVSADYLNFKPLKLEI